MGSKRHARRSKAEKADKMKGMFITFEGPEGGGKSTQIKLLAKRLKAAGRRVMITREPGGTPTGELIRDVLQHNKSGEALLPETELLLFEASRAQLVRKVILPAIQKGVVVLCDRFFDSTTAYQGYGRGMDLKGIDTMNRVAAGRAVPGLTILIDVSHSTGFGRLRRRNHAMKTGHDRIERENRSFHQRVRRGFIRIARENPGRIKVVDGSRDLKALEADIWKIVKRCLP